MDSTTTPPTKVNFNKAETHDSKGFFGPNDELSIEEKLQCLEEAELEITREYKMDISTNLQPDSITQLNQSVALISFVGPYENLRCKHDTFQFSIRGAFTTTDIAEKKIKSIWEKTQEFDIYTIGMYEWVAFPPNPEYMESVEKHEKYLNDIICLHTRDMVYNDKMYELRKLHLKNNPDLNTHPSITTLEDSTSESTTESTTESTIFPLDDLIPPRKISIKDKENCCDFDSSEVLEGGSDYQKWVVFSTVGDLEKTGMAIKIKGFFETEEQAKLFLDTNTKDDIFDSFIVQANRWLPGNPDKNEIEQNNSNPELDLLINETQKQKVLSNEYCSKKESEGVLPLVPQLVNTTQEDITASISLEIMEEGEQHI